MKLINKQEKSHHIIKLILFIQTFKKFIEEWKDLGKNLKLLKTQEYLEKDVSEFATL
jgi:hypothetical protein